MYRIRGLNTMLLIVAKVHEIADKLRGVVLG